MILNTIYFTPTSLVDRIIGSARAKAFLSLHISFYLVDKPPTPRLAQLIYLFIAFHAPYLNHGNKSQGQIWQNTHILVSFIIIWPINYQIPFASLHSNSPPWFIMVVGRRVYRIRVWEGNIVGIKWEITNLEIYKKPNK